MRRKRTHSVPTGRLLAVLPPACACVAAIACSAILLRRHKRKRRRSSPSASGAGRVKRNQTNSNVPVSRDAITEQQWQELTSTEPQNDAEPQRTPLQTELVAMQLQCTPAQLLLYLFHPASDFARLKAERLSLTNFDEGQWTSSAGKLPWQRKITYDMPLTSRLGPSHAHNIETHTLQQCSTSKWQLMIGAVQPNVPLGSTFSTHVLYQVRQTDASTTQLHISGELSFSTRGVSLLRGTITSAWKKGTANTYAAIQSILQEEFADGAQPGGPSAAVKGVPGQLQPIQASRHKTLARRNKWSLGSLGIVLAVCLLALLCQLPFVPIGQVQMYQHLLAAKLLQLMNALH